MRGQQRLLDVELVQQLGELGDDEVKRNSTKPHTTVMTMAG